MNGSYNSLVGQQEQKSCLSCPRSAITQGVSSTSASDCVCESGSYNSNPDRAAAPNCLRCPAGTSCTQNAVDLRTLPLRAGYFRQSLESIDIRRCPDASSGDASGCRGGALSACGPGLLGTFCSHCNRSGAGQVYYVAASNGKHAHCEDCGSTLASTIGLAVGLIALVFTLGVCLPRWRLQLIERRERRLAVLVEQERRSNLPKRRVERDQDVTRVLSLATKLARELSLTTKLKIVISFCAAASLKPRTNLTLLHPPTEIHAPTHNESPSLFHQTIWSFLQTARALRPPPPDV